MESKKLWIIGDSFTGSGTLEYKTWTDIICEKFLGDDFYASSEGSRDAQTIIDIFLRNLKNIQRNDIVIIFLPDLSRVRLPLKKAAVDVQKLKNDLNHFEKLKMYKNYFVGHPLYESNCQNEMFELEDPLNYFCFSESNSDINLKLSKIINSSIAYRNNLQDIIESLKSYVPFELDFYSWTDIWTSETINRKATIETNIGFWHTWNDLYNETNGSKGYKSDAHFSPKMNEAFANFLIKKHKNYFKQI